MKIGTLYHVYESNETDTKRLINELHTLDDLSPTGLYDWQLSHMNCDYASQDDTETTKTRTRALSTTLKDTRIKTDILNEMHELTSEMPGIIAFMTPTKKDLEALKMDYLSETYNAVQHELRNIGLHGFATDKNAACRIQGLLCGIYENRTDYVMLSNWNTFPMPYTLDDFIRQLKICTTYYILPETLTLYN